MRYNLSQSTRLQEAMYILYMSVKAKITTESLQYHHNHHSTIDQTWSKNVVAF
jgi:hypothetical protein